MGGLRTAGAFACSSFCTLWSGGVDSLLFSYIISFFGGKDSSMGGFFGLVVSWGLDFGKLTFRRCEMRSDVTWHISKTSSLKNGLRELGGTFFNENTVHNSLYVCVCFSISSCFPFLDEVKYVNLKDVLTTVSKTRHILLSPS